MNTGAYNIKSLTPEHTAAVRSLAALPEFTGEFTTLSAGKDACKWLSHPASVVACDDAGTLIGFLLCDLQPMEGKEWQVLLRGAVVPEWRRRGVGAALLAEATTLLRRGSEKVTLLALFGWMPCEALAGFAQSQGFAFVRHFHSMVRDATEIPPPLWTEGFAPRVFDGTDAMFASWNTAYNAGFASHFRFRPRTEADCRKIAAADDFLAENVILLFHGSEPAGLVRVAVCDHGDQRTGEVTLLCVPPPFRGRGLGRALLRAGLQRLQSSGCSRFCLTVDAGGPVAPQLYAAEGFRSSKVRAIWERSL